MCLQNKNERNIKRYCYIIFIYLRKREVQSRAIWFTGEYISLTKHKSKVYETKLINIELLQPRDTDKYSHITQNLKRRPKFIWSTI